MSSVGSLPQGWERTQAPDGRIYYVDHNTQQTHWQLPAVQQPAPHPVPAEVSSQPRSVAGDGQRHEALGAVASLGAAAWSYLSGASADELRSFMDEAAFLRASEQPGEGGRTGSGSEVEPTPVGNAMRTSIASKVQALSGSGVWRDCRVVDIMNPAGTAIKVHWIGFSDQWDEWVREPHRVRLPPQPLPPRLPVSQAPPPRLKPSAEPETLAPPDLPPVLVNEQAASTLSVGQAVTWTQSDSDIPAGAVGTIRKQAPGSPGHFQITFPSGVYEIPASELMPLASAGQVHSQNVATERTRVGEPVQWKKADGEIPRGSVGTIQSAQPDGRYRVCFPSGTYDLKADELSSTETQEQAVAMAAEGRESRVGAFNADGSDAGGAQPAAALPALPALPAASPVTPEQVSVGRPCFVLSSSGIWRDCTAVEKDGCVVKVHYVGFDRQFDERIDLSRPASQRRVAVKFPAVMPWFLEAEPHDEFVLEGKLGQGAFGLVTLASRKDDGVLKPYQVTRTQKFAIKQIQTKNLRDEVQVEAFQSEACLQFQLQHPNICQLYEVYSTPGVMYMVTELVTGGDLFEGIEAAPNHLLSEEFAARVMWKSCLALQYMHENGVAHRDIKPANIMLLKDCHTNERSGERDIASCARCTLGLGTHAIGSHG